MTLKFLKCSYHVRKRIKEIIIPSYFQDKATAVKCFPRSHKADMAC